MKRLILIAGAMILCSQMNAQPWMNQQNDAPVRLLDILEQHYSNAPSSAVKDEEHDADMPAGVEKETGDYHFDRWLWYWKQHTDANGYLVSPIKNFEEWQAYQQRHNVTTKLARTTGSPNMSAWTSQGPDTTTGGYGGLGRINVIAFHPTDTSTYWIGSPGGGAWKTTDDGNHWTCMTDGLPLLSVSDIDFNPINPNTIYLCTGDRDAGDYYSIGVLKSTDGGTTWDTTGLHWSTNQYRLTNALVINPKDTNSLVLAASDGIYKSNNGGTTWNRMINGSFKDVVYNPADTSVLYAAGSEQIYRSGNGGYTWTQMTHFTNVNHVAIAVTAANPAIVKAVTSSSSGANANGLDGVYASSDTGMTFREVYTGTCDSNILGYAPDGKSCGGQGWYDLCITMNQRDSDLVYVGGVNSWFSPDGGKSWQLMTFWYEDASLGVEIAHADKHYMAFSPHRSRRLFQCNDGGVYMSDNPTGTGWANKLTNGLRITEFYRNAVADDTTYVLGGAQDNGTKMITDSAKSYDVGGGDGMECQIDFSDPNIYYVAYPSGSIDIHNHGHISSISNNIPGNPSGAWVTPYTLMPSSSGSIVAGYKMMYYSISYGSAWTAMSDTLPAYSYSYIEHIGLTPADPTTMYAIVDYEDTVFYTHDAATWYKLHVPFGRYTYMSGIQVDPTDTGHFWVTFSGYDTVKVAEYKSGSGWKSISKDLPNVPVNCIEMDTSNRILYIGTDIGVFYKNDTMTAWQPYNNGLPAVRVNDLGISYSRDEIWAATYGRGMWKSPKQVFDTTTHTHVGISVVPFALNAMNIYPNPSRGNFTISMNNTTNGAVNIRMVDYAGRVAWEGNGTFDDNKLQVNTGGLARGTYIVEISTAQNIVGRGKVIIY